MKTIRVIAIAFAIVASGLHAIHAQQSGSKRIDLQRHDLSAPGREVIQVRVEFDPGYAAPRHTHPGEEIIYVIQGTLEYDIGGKVSRVKGGDVLFVPAGVVHTAKNIGNDKAAELATYVVEKGKPLITLAGQDVPDVRVAGHSMIITSIHYTFASKDADKAESLFRELRDASMKEPGVIQFEVGRSTDDPNVFALWEVYRDQAASDAHRESEHFKRLVLNGIRPIAQQRNAATLIPISNVNE
jgi:quercetin dioxygenase-like cupin family protein/quinol monooxygenase YgiN